MYAVAVPHTVKVFAYEIVIAHRSVFCLSNSSVGTGTAFSTTQVYVLNSGSLRSRFVLIMSFSFIDIPPFVLGFLFNSIAVTWVSSLSLEMKKADPIGFSVLRDTNKIGRSNKFVLKTL